MKKVIVLFIGVLLLSFFFQDARVWGEATGYRIATGDILKVSVYNQPDLATTVRVNTAGEVTLPLVNKVAVAGLFTAQAEDLITSRLAKDFLIDPYVQVFISEYHPEQISVLGAVQKPGTYAISPIKQTTLLEGLAMADGLNGNANSEKVVILRQHNGERVFLPVNVKEITRQGVSSNNVNLRADDIILVDESYVKYVTVLGAVKKFGKYEISKLDNTTFLDVIAMAGGFQEGANIDRTRLIRKYQGVDKAIAIKATNITKAKCVRILRYGLEISSLFLKARWVYVGFL